ncbi:MAG: Re/Si-specific NAD(P)(+) transhydrogenase subunit alpha [Ferruginibacter sp.]
MIIGLLKEPSFETRVALLPEHIKTIQSYQSELLVESGAGELAFADDASYTVAGGTVVSRSELIRRADLLICIHPPIDAMACSGKVMIGFFQALFNDRLMAEWAANNITTFSMDMLPRTTRAQSMDVLSSQANIAGYKAVLHAASSYARYFPMFMTAAGSIAPAKVLILGAGVAGLQAIATAKRLGAVIEVFDTRPAVKEEVMSLGAKFIEVEGAADASKAGGYAVEQSDDFMQRQKAKIAASVAKADIVITTAQIPGRQAPILITEEMIHTMRSGSVIVDLAASTGGNTALTKNDQTVSVQGVTIVGNSMLPSTMPSDASKLYGKNILNFLALILTKDGTLNLNFSDDLVQGTCVTHAGQVTQERIQALIQS